MKYKVYHFGTLDKRDGGPPFSQYNTIKGLARIGIDSISVSPPIETSSLIGNDIPIIYWSKSPNRLGCIFNIKNEFKILDKANIFHIQGIWHYYYTQIANYAKKNHIPYIWTPRGALYPQALNKSYLKKRLARLFYQDKSIKNASCILATCNDEMKYLRELGYTNPIAIIPNPIDFIDENNIAKTPNIRKIGYFGRLHPRKRVERLIYAFADNRDIISNSELIIIGEDDKAYEAFLKKEVERLNLKDKVFFKGFLEGQKKIDEIKNLTFSTLPSDFENFGNVISEALALGKPVLTTTGAPWEIVHKYNCGWWIDNTQENISNVIKQMLTMDENEILKMSKNGIKLIKENFTKEIIADKHRQLYNWILGKETKPDFVHVID